MRWGPALPPAGQSAAGPFPIRVLLPTFPAPLRPCFLPTGCAGGIGPATCGQAPAYFATRRYLAAAARREWPLSGTHFSEPYFRFWPDSPIQAVRVTDRSRLSRCPLDDSEPRTSGTSGLA